MKFVILFVSLVIFQIQTVESSSSAVPAPENPIYAREQIFLSPFKTYTGSTSALTCGQLIVYHGFQYEVHQVITEDGYILELYRIINPDARDAFGDKLVPVLLVHGVLESCGSWLINSNNQDGPLINVTSNNLAVVLATRGFDVWLANNRGTSYSRKHIHLNSYTDSSFWNFSFVDLGRYDAPAMIYHIINVTNYEKVVWIGYSTGATQMLCKLSEDPSFADNLSLIISISPVAFNNNPPGVLGALSRSRALNLLLGRYVGPIPQFLPETNAMLTLFAFIFPPIFEEINNYIFGPDRQMIDNHHYPAFESVIDTTSAKLLLHYIQAFRLGQLRYYDNGDDENLALYGSKYPPKINFQNVPTKRLILMTGINDFLAKPKNIQRLRNILKGRPLIDHIINYPRWNHIDIIIGEKAFEYTHLPIVGFIRKYVGTEFTN